MAKPNQSESILCLVLSLCRFTSSRVSLEVNKMEFCRFLSLLHELSERSGRQQM